MQRKVKKVETPLNVQALVHTQSGKHAATSYGKIVVLSSYQSFSAFTLFTKLLKLQTSQSPLHQCFLENVQYAEVKVQQATR